MAKRINARPLMGLAAGMALAGCMNFSSLDDIETAPQPKSPFALALFQDYVFLARSFGDVGQAGYIAFDQEGSIPLTDTDQGVAALANAFAAKALALSRDELVDPEASRDVRTHELRDRLVRALNPGRDAFPRDAARAQADWDCWRLNERTTGQAAAAQQCQKSFITTLPRLEAEVAAAAKAAQAAQAAAEAAKKAAAQQQNAQQPNAAASGSEEIP